MKSFINCRAKLPVVGTPKSHNRFRGSPQSRMNNSRESPPSKCGEVVIITLGLVRGWAEQSSSRLWNIRTFFNTNGCELIRSSNDFKTSWLIHSSRVLIWSSIMSPREDSHTSGYVVDNCRSCSHAASSSSSTSGTEPATSAGIRTVPPRRTVAIVPSRRSCSLTDLATPMAFVSTASSCGACCAPRRGSAAVAGNGVVMTTSHGWAWPRNAGSSRWYSRPSRKRLRRISHSTRYRADRPAQCRVQ
mmetsp:Transcript_94/g.320  ORF Transcript_94/g.320 Transcript_94/m.320 type:complete len:246 (-) Transcript_94:487-1224(-)